MLILHLMRHAKAARPAGIRDRERPLNEQGRSDAAAVARARAAELGRVELVLCSDSTRTRQTVAVVRPWLPGAVEIAYEPGLYLATDDAILAQLRRPGTDQVRLVVGHNDGLWQAAARLAAAGPRRLIERIGAGLPTSGFASYEIDRDDWAELIPAAARLTGLLVPRDLE